MLPEIYQVPEGGGQPPHRLVQRPLEAVLDVVAVISNPIRYDSRFNLYRAFERMVAAAGARLTTVELAYGDRPFEVTEPGDPRDIQLRTRYELWHKENLLNIGISRLPDDWQYVAWVDADVAFARPDWVQETVQQLQHYQVVQMFSEAIYLGPTHRPTGKVHRSFVAAYLAGDPPWGSDYSAKAHPGFAWAARREAIDALGGLLDITIMGAGDRHMAMALLGVADACLPPGLSPGYMEQVRIWQDRADRHIRRNVGCVDGLLLHYWHGKLKDRRYSDRWKALIDWKYDPEFDLKRDWQGVYQLTDRNPGLRDAIRRYLRARAEDSSDE